MLFARLFPAASHGMSASLEIESAAGFGSKSGQRGSAMIETRHSRGISMPSRLRGCSVACPPESMAQSEGNLEDYHPTQLQVSCT